MSTPRLHTALGLLALLPLQVSAQDTLGDPRAGEVHLTAAAGWQAFHLYASDSGIWTVRSFQLLERYGCPEVVGLDDRGRCSILVPYSGKWSPLQTIEDGEWMGAIAHVDIDPGFEGPELYVGGKRGTLYQIRPLPAGGFDTRIIARFPGLELHTLVGGELLPSSPGKELLAFTHSGETFQLRATPGTATGFTARPLARLPGRVRDARILVQRGAEAPRIAVAARSGEVTLLQMEGNGLKSEPLLREPMGFGRLARRKVAPGQPEVLYATRDDGLVLRLEEGPQGWKREPIFAGPQGPRGIVAGRFDPDPQAETVAVFGYCAKVHLLTRHPGASWTVETIFTDRDRGHWLEVAELDGRNTTDEILGSGYGGRIFLLSRPPGAGHDGIPADEGKD